MYRERQHSQRKKRQRQKNDAFIFLPTFLLLSNTRNEAQFFEKSNSYIDFISKMIPPSLCVIYAIFCIWCQFLHNSSIVLSDNIFRADSSIIAYKKIRLTICSPAKATIHCLGEINFATFLPPIPSQLSIYRKRSYSVLAQDNFPKKVLKTAR